MVSSRCATEVELFSVNIAVVRHYCRVLTVLADLRHGSGAISKTGTAIALWRCRECVTAATSCQPLWLAKVG